MDKFFDDINDFILSLLGLNKKRSSSDKDSSEKATGHKQYTDPDMQSAWEELEDFLKGEQPGASRQSSRQSNRQSGKKETATDYETYQREKERERLKQDYANLEVPYGSGFEQVKKAFKTLLIKYHPDKHSHSTEKARIATEITQKLNASFQKIKAFEEKYSQQKDKKK